MKKHCLLTFLITSLCCSQLFSQTFVQSWQTSTNASKLFQKQTDKEFTDGEGNNSIKIRLNDTKTYQAVEGFGWTMTQGSAYVIRQLSDAQQTAILEELFSVEKGLGSATVRVPLGASDLGQGAYTYQDNKNAAFSLAGPDLTYLVPVLQKLVQVNPEVKFMASPWSAPAWMKTPFSGTGTQQLRGGSLKKEHFGDYADYLLKYFQEMEKQGIKFHSMTIQNEPLTEHNWPSMYMSKEDQYDFVENHLGPKLKNNGYGYIKLIGYDHNCDNTEYPIHVARSQYIEGSAFHLYGGTIDAMQRVYDQTGKSVYFTEQWSDGRNWGFNGSDFTWDMQNVMLGATQNMSKTALMWNVASDQNMDPHTDDGGCDVCKGAITINTGSKEITRNQTYYEVAQMSKVTRFGSLRIQSTSTDGSLNNVAFTNPDGTTSLVVFNQGGDSKTFDIVWNGKSCSYTLAGNTVVSLIWAPILITVPVTSVTVTPGSKEINRRDVFQLSATVFPENATLKSVRWSSSNEQVATVDENGLVLARNEGKATITATTVNEQKTATCEITVLPNMHGTGDFPHVYYIKSVYSSKLLDVKDRNMDSGAELQQWEDNGGGDNQKWIFEYDGGDVYFIKSKFSDLYIQAMNSGDDGKLRLHAFTGDENQQWKIEEVTSGVYKMTSVAHGTVIDLAGPSDADGAEIHLWKNFDSPNQQWMIDIADIVSAISASMSNSVLAYPNPTTGNVNLTFDSVGKRTLDLFTVSGKLLCSHEIDESFHTLDLYNATKGVYLLKIKDGERIDRIKIIKQ